jgi:NIMA (never in mitosis gene a)-related kinase 1/4/5
MNALNEVRILASVTHKNVIAYKEAFYDNEEKALCIIMEYANDRDLYQ